MSYKCSRLWNLITTSLGNLLLQILQKEKIATKIAAKIARVNGPLEGVLTVFGDWQERTKYCPETIRHQWHAFLLKFACE